jgi:opacity protein-like surface antigen
MNLRNHVTTAAVIAAFGAALPTVAAAQAGSGITWPHQSGFWGHLGASVGTADLDSACPAGATCDSTEQLFRLYGGGRFNNIFGGEVGFIKFGNFKRGDGRTDAKGVDFTLLAGVPFGTNKNWSVFGKLGTLYSDTDVNGTTPGLQTGDETGWGTRVGLGLQAGITENWAVRADLDRWRIKLPGGRDNIDTLMLGAQYTFR